MESRDANHCLSISKSGKLLWSEFLHLGFVSSPHFNPPVKLNRVAFRSIVQFLII
jgi:hypothetical protein